jgi:wyosine [tRNA(Phe)-imidazoG37] synthetase (radical SAM superfamily)
MKHVYGPVPSRRLGFSLGVDIIPYKTCTLDCIYCQLGRTTNKTIVRKPYAIRDDIIEEIKLFLKRGKDIDFITFSGSGEPTLNSEIGILIREIKRMVSVPVAVLTNGTLLYMEDVQQAVLEADVVMPSLDAASFEMFQKINRPHRDLKIDLIIDGLKRFREIYEGHIWLEIMLIKGFNAQEDELSKIKKAVSQIRPDKIHLNTVIRPPSEIYAGPLNIEEMADIKEFFGKECEVIGKFHAKGRKRTEDIRLYTLETTKRRPLTTIDIANVFGISETNATRMIKKLKAEGIVKEKLYGTKRYYIFSHKKERVKIH